MRKAALAIPAVAILVGLGLLVAGALSDRSEAFTLGVPQLSVSKIKPGQEMCQTPVFVPDDAAFDGVRMAVGTNGLTGSEMRVTVRAAGDGPSGLTGPVLGRGTLPAGYPDVDRAAAQTIWVTRVPPGRRVAVCLGNVGTRAAYVYGAPDIAVRNSSAYLDGKPLDLDLSMRFARRDPPSITQLIPAIFARASLFRAEFAGAWIFWALALLMIVLVPALLVRAVRSAAA